MRKNIKASGKDVEKFIEGIEPEKRAVAQALRRLVKQEAPGLKEAIKWGNVCWIGKSNVCWLIVYQEHVDFGFFMGTSLKDPAGLLEGTGKGLRHIKVHSPADIKPKAFGALLKQAVALDSRGG